MTSSMAGGKKRIILGVSGASGAVLARRTLQMLEADARVEKIHLVISGSGLKLLRDELHAKRFEVGGNSRCARCARNPEN